MKKAIVLVALLAVVGCKGSPAWMNSASYEEVKPLLQSATVAQLCNLSNVSMGNVPLRTTQERAIAELEARGNGVAVCSPAFGECQSLGMKPKTPEFVKCFNDRQALYQQQQMIGAQNRIADEIKNQPMQSNSMTCHHYGNYSTCN